MQYEDPKWGPNGVAVYERTYSRTKPDGSQENWADTVERVVDGNLNFVANKYHEKDERQKLFDLLYNFRALPAGRHLWMTGVQGRSFIMNCHHSGWDDDITEHFTFTFDQLMQGGGVGSNYSNRFIKRYKAIKNSVEVHIVCDPEHSDYSDLRHSVTGYALDGSPTHGDLLSDQYSADWAGATRVDDSREGWTEALATLLNSFWSGTSTTLVFDVSNVRHSGSRIRSFGGTAAGPAPLAILLLSVAELLNTKIGNKVTSLDLMLIDHFIATCVVSGNVRRSARMAIKSWVDPDILEFINCKADSIYHWSTNISVEVDDHFFKALKKSDSHANEVYRAVVAGMVKNGEPGFYNHSLAQVGEVNEVASTNPCAEITLEEQEPCNLGHVNLDSFVNDFEGAVEAHRLMTRFLIRATFCDIPNVKQRAVLDRNRRIGVGHFGYQGWINKMGVRYSDSHRNPYVQKTLKDFYEAVRKEARRYAFQLRIPEPIKVTTVAPTGTIAKLAGRTEGIHPIYAKYFIRRIRYSTVDPLQSLAIDSFIDQGYNVVDDIYAPNTKVVEFPTQESLLAEVEALGLDAEHLVESADEISLEDMLAVQALYQEYYSDNAVSFTVNFPEKKYSVDDVAGTLRHYLPRLKGTTLMPDGTRELAPYERISKADFELYQYTLVGDGVDEECLKGCPVK